MNQIMISCCEINNTTFPCCIDGEEYISLTDFVHKITRKANFPFSAQLTDLTDRKVLVYSCTFSRTGCPAKLLFIRSENFFGTNFFTFDSQNSIIKHCFHPNDVHFVQCHRNCISSEVCQEIVHQTKLGVPPGRIRSNLDIQCGSNLFYDIRRTAIEEERNEEVDMLRRVPDFVLHPSLTTVNHPL